MSRVLTFSRVFPIYHPRKGEPTYFVEKIWESIKMKDPDYISQFIWGDWLDQKFEPKHHTIRAGHRWKAGDKFSPRVWSGKPYQSKQIIIAPDIEVKKVWDFEVFIDIKSGYDCVRLNGVLLHEFDGNEVFMGGHLKLRTIAKNDGLEFEDFGNWFNKTMKGQIICWNENIEY